MGSKKSVPSGDLIEALVILRQGGSVSSSTKALLRDAERETGLKADSVTELVNLNAFNVRGARRLLLLRAAWPARDRPRRAVAVVAWPWLVVPVARKPCASLVSSPILNSRTSTVG